MNSSYKCKKCEKRFYTYKAYNKHLEILNCKRLLPTIENVRKDILEVKKDILDILDKIKKL